MKTLPSFLPVLPQTLKLFFTLVLAIAGVYWIGFVAGVFYFLAESFISLIF